MWAGQAFLSLAEEGPLSWLPMLFEDRLRNREQVSRSPRFISGDFHHISFQAENKWHSPGEHGAKWGIEGDLGREGDRPVARLRAGNVGGLAPCRRDQRRRRARHLRNQKRIGFCKSMQSKSYLA